MLELESVALVQLINPQSFGFGFVHLIERNQPSPVNEIGGVARGGEAVLIKAERVDCGEMFTARGVKSVYAHCGVHGSKQIVHSQSRYSQLLLGHDEFSKELTEIDRRFAMVPHSRREMHLHVFQLVSVK